MTQGPISYREAMLYADEMEMGPDLRSFMWDVIRRVDSKFLKLLGDKLQAETKKR